MQTCEIVHRHGSVELNRSAGEILARCDGTRALDEIIGELETRFGIAGLAADVYRFVDAARRLGWLTELALSHRATRQTSHCSTMQHLFNNASMRPH